jgi:hypothetical protein
LLTRCLLAALAAEQGDQAAAGNLEAVLEEARRHQDPEPQTLALDALARVAAAAGDHPRAAGLLEEADGLHALVGHTLDDTDRLDARAARAAL